MNYFYSKLTGIFKLRASFPFLVRALIRLFILCSLAWPGRILYMLSFMTDLWYSVDPEYAANVTGLNRKNFEISS